MSNITNGKVRLAKQIHFRAPSTMDKKYPKQDGFTTVSVCSGGGKIGKALSPFTLGPVTSLEHCDLDLPEAKVFENFWQNLKVFTMEIDEKTGKPSDKYFIRRNKGFSDVKPHRRVYSSKDLSVKYKGAKCEYTWWKENKLTWIEARKQIYCPLYADLVQKTAAFRDLKSRMENGENLLLIGYDGFDLKPDIYTEDELLNVAKKHLEDTTKSVGHEFVLVCLLMNLKPWLE